MVFWLKSLCLLCMLALPAQARNLAFVLGSDSYKNVAPLLKARSDAYGYATFFADKGFEVFAHADLGQRDMVVALAAFLDAIRPGDTVVFAYSGHGWSNGTENFLLPTDIRITGSQTLIEKESFVLKNGVNGILDEITRRGAALTVAIIDACRDNPFQAADGTRSVGLARGLVPVQAPVGTFIAFSAGAGQTALDRLSDADSVPYSVFTRSFLQELGKPQDLQTAFKATQQSVNELARTVGHAQRPAYYDEVIGSACLTGACDPAAVPVVQPVPEPRPSIPQQLDAAAEWQDFRNSNSIEVLELFAKRHAGTAYAALALERAAGLRAAAAPKPAPEQTEKAVVPEPVPAPAPAPVKQAALPGWCKAAATPSEKTVCKTPDLAAKDIQMTRLFSAKKKAVSSAAWERVKWDQRQWLKNREACKWDLPCLRASYDRRIGQLR
ncbi:caspase family protein [Actibacterium ureilyticum]|uniref:caspase family protein n=1 Tax=Actibacterium ureilyticum TaxID=1590614 RepID=UPI000BAAD160|nr:caspase family protein [Actibacterium ureilyticum]